MLKVVLKPLSRGVEESENALIHGKHDGRAGHCSHEMGSQAAVETHETLFNPDELEALNQARVLGQPIVHRRLSKSGSRNLSSQ